MTNNFLRVNRHRFATVLVAFAFCAILSSCAGSAAPGQAVLPDAYYANLYQYDNGQTFLGRGLNLGNFFDAPPSRSYPMGEGEWNGGFALVEADLDNIKAMGFKSLRVPVRWADHIAPTAPYQIDPIFLARVKEVVDWSLARGFVVVLNVHHYVSMMNDGPAALPGHRARLSAIWDQLCDAFPTEDYPADALVFELLNEPNGTVGYASWNSIIAELAELIWVDHAGSQAGRKIMVGTANWGGVSELKKLELPSACTPSNTIVTVHYYEPYHFTHQGAEWAPGSTAWIGTRWRGTEADKASLLDLLDSVVAWNLAHGFEIYVGEFGAYSRYVRPEDQKAWTAFVAREAEHRGMSWAYWEYLSGLGAYDPVAKRWRAHIIDALIPVEDRP